MYWDSFSSIDNIFIHGLFCSKWNFFSYNIISRTFPDFVKFKDIVGPGKLICFPGRVETPS